MKKAITILLAVVMTAAVVDVAVVAASASTTRAKTLSPTTITISDYPKQVTVNETFNVTGRLTSSNNGISSAQVWHELYIAKNNVWRYRWVITTDNDGYFSDSFSFTGPGTYKVRYEYNGNDQYSCCTSAEMVITAVS